MNYKLGDIVVYRNGHTGSVAVAVVTRAAGTYSVDVIAGSVVADVRIREEDLRPCDYPTFKSITALNIGTRTMEQLIWDRHREANERFEAITEEHLTDEERDGILSIHLEHVEARKNEERAHVLGA